MMNEWDFNRRIDESKYGTSDLPQYPVRTLVGHVAMKGVQVGAVAGLVAGVPLIAYLRKLPASHAWRRVMPIAPVIGSALSLTGLFVLNYTKPMGFDGIDDRAYRIMHNKGQVRVDQRTILGGAIGAAVGTAVAPGLVSILAASSTGVAAAFVYDKGESLGLWKRASAEVDKYRKQFASSASE